MADVIEINVSTGERTERDYTQEEFRKSDEFRDIFDSVVEPGGAINNYIKSLGMSPEKTKKVIQK